MPFRQSPGATANFTHLASAMVVAVGHALPAVPPEALPLSPTGPTDSLPAAAPPAPVKAPALPVVAPPDPEPPPATAVVPASPLPVWAPAIDTSPPLPATAADPPTAAPASEAATRPVAITPAVPALSIGLAEPSASTPDSAPPHAVTLTSNAANQMLFMILPASLFLPVNSGPCLRACDSAAGALLKVAPSSVGRLGLHESHAK